jgi:predicted acetyltransferase
MWTRYLGDAIEGPKRSFVAVHVDPHGAVDGYVHYDVAWQESSFGENDFGAGQVHDLFGADAAVERALWAFLLDIDLIKEWKAEDRPIDDSIRFAARDTRAYELHARWDEQWLRLLDVDAALTARTYRPCDGAINIGVDDPMFSENCGAWRIDAKGAEPTDLEPDLVVDVEVLGAAYLGGTSWRELADAGRVDVRRSGAIDDADTLFAEHPAPFCGSFF